jgi:hypothetical protein
MTFKSTRATSVAIMLRNPAWRQTWRRTVAQALTRAFACAGSRGEVERRHPRLHGVRWCDATERDLNEQLMGRRGSFGRMGKR